MPAIHDRVLAKLIEDKVKKILKSDGTGPWGWSCNAYERCDADGALAICAPDSQQAARITLPCRVPEKNCFPSERMLAYMDIKPLPLRKAKPRDWIARAEDFAHQMKAAYLARRK